MTVQAHVTDRRLVVLAVLGVVLALTAAMWVLAGCAPKDVSEAPAVSEQSGGSTSGSSAMDGQPANWTMESDCSMCHTTEAASETDTACPQGTAHKAEGVACVQCHTEKDVLATEHADVKFGDKPAAKATAAQKSVGTLAATGDNAAAAAAALGIAGATVAAAGIAATKRRKR